MRKKLTISLIILCVITITSIFIPIFSYAEDAKSSLGIDLGNLDEYKKEEIEAGSLENIAENIIGIISVIGMVVSVVSLMAIGIKYMLGSIEERAKYKETLKPYIIGAFLVFTVSLIPELIYQFMQNF